MRRCGATIGGASMSTSAPVELMRTYGTDYKLILVGDATMSPYEITQRAAASSTGMPRRAACGCSA